MDNGWEAQQIVLGVARCADRSDIRGMVDYFSADAVLQVGDRSVKGKEAIFEFFGGGSASSAATERTKHVVTNILVVPDGTELLLDSYFQVLRSWGIANWGRYEDRLAHADGALLIVHRKVVVDGQIARPPRPPEAPSGEGRAAPS